MIRTVPSCIDLLPPLRVVLSIDSSWDFFPLSHDPFLLCSTLPSQMRLSPPPSSSSQALLFSFSFLLSSHSFVSPPSLTACRAFGSLHWCLYMLAYTYLLRLVLPSLRPLRGLCSSCSRPAISTLLVVLKYLHSSRRLEIPSLFSSS